MTFNEWWNKQPEDDQRNWSELMQAAWNAATEQQAERIKELEAEVEALTDCLNGSSKAVYTAEMYDKGIDEARASAFEELVEAIYHFNTHSGGKIVAGQDVINFIENFAKGSAIRAKKEGRG